LESRGLSKLQFAKELQRKKAVRKARGEPTLRKVDRPALYSFLQGRDVPPTDTLAEMAAILNVRTGWLAEGEQPVERGLADGIQPIWVIDGQRGPWKRPALKKRLEARLAFLEFFLGRARGYHEAEPVVRLIFHELLSRRLERRRNRGDRGPADPEYRAKTARGLYLKCFLDVMDELPQKTEFSSPTFTSAFLSGVGRWIEDESG
jgi:hypothetical protein